jgi:UDPglucose--hexose-1-phosphate uridylyltransferase
MTTSARRLRGRDAPATAGRVPALLYCRTCCLLPIGEFGGIRTPELRQNFFTKEWVIIATERAKRPEDLATHRVVQPVSVFVESCPFCPGNESKTQPTRSLRHLQRRFESFGFHEVIIDSPDHSRYMGLLSDEHVAGILRVYKERYNALSLDHRVNHITIFKNHGTDAGASLQHPTRS